MRAVFRRQRNADAGADTDVGSADGERLGDKRDDLGGKNLRGLGLF